MKIITSGQDRYIVLRSCGQDQEKANIVANLMGCTLIREISLGTFLICMKIPEAEFYEIN